jgi:pimeloyl-ACP methyl ester carboxylesterase
MATWTSSAVQSVRVPVRGGVLDADLTVPEDASGLVIFAHGSGSGRHSPRNQFVARALNAEHQATLLADLLTLDEERADRITAHLRFDIELLAGRLTELVDWAGQDARLKSLPVGLFGASTGAAAALVAASNRPERIWAVVSRGGRPDLARQSLAFVVAPTLLLVGGLDTEVLALNQWARRQLHGRSELEIIPGAGHLFEEPGKLELIASYAARWFAAQFTRRPATGKATR